MGTPVKWGNEFLVNTTTEFNQVSPAITALADGRFVVTWTDGSALAGTTSWDIRAQVFNANGSALGAEFLVNATLASQQGSPTITALADGRFVVTWQDFSRTGGDTSVFAVRAQVFNPDGSVSGAEFLVNTTTNLSQTSPTITALTDGRFVVAWTDYSANDGDTSGQAVRAQVFNSDGSASGGECLVNTTTSGEQTAPTITTLVDGRFVVAWADGSATGADTSGSAVRAQAFNPDGSASGTEFLVNTTTLGNQFDPAITGLADGRFVVAWTDNSQTGADTSAYAVRAQVYNADGSASGTEVLVNTTSQDNQNVSTITALADGRFVVAWMDNSQTGADTSSSAVRAQVFNPDGSASGTEFLVNTTTPGSQGTPTITALADGRLVVAWADGSQTGGDLSSGAVRAQIFDPREVAVNLTGSTLGDDFIGTAFGDTMQGNAGDDRLVGKGGDDLLTGDDGQDRLFGRRGGDTLAGGVGDDKLKGGKGHDTFVFDISGGHDTVTDFHDGADIIDLSGFGLADFAAAQQHFTASGADVVFTAGPNTLLIQNFTIAQLDTSDLIL